MNKNKKGAELSINVIIVPVIALVVLAILIFIFSGRSQICVNSVSQTCGDLGGECKGEGQCPEGKYLIYAKECGEADKNGQKGVGPCCVPYEK